MQPVAGSQHEATCKARERGAREGWPVAHGTVADQHILGAALHANGVVAVGDGRVLDERAITRHVDAVGLSDGRVVNCDAVHKCIEARRIKHERHSSAVREGDAAKRDIAHIRHVEQPWPNIVKFLIKPPALARAVDGTLAVDYDVSHVIHLYEAAHFRQ